MNLVIAIIILAALACLWLFYDKFTKRGAIPLAKAFRDFTTWFGLVNVALADWIVALLQWVASFWDQLQVTIGPALAAPGFEKFVMVWGALMLALKFKGQKPLPKPVLPAFPEDTAAPSA